MILLKHFMTTALAATLTLSVMAIAKAHPGHGSGDHVHAEAASMKSETEQMVQDNVRGWNIGCYVYKRSAVFSHCAMSSKFKGNTWLLFSIAAGETDGKLYLTYAVTSPNWSFKEDAPYQIGIDLGDSRRKSTQTCHGVRYGNHEGIRCVEPFSKEAVDVIMRAHVIGFHVGSERLTGFQLKGSYRAMSRIMDYTSQGLEAAPPEVASRKRRFDPDGAPAKKRRFTSSGPKLDM